MSDAVTHALSHRALVRVEGDGAGEFLQDLLTADILGLPEGTARAAALLTPQGRVLFDLVAAREGDAVLLECDRDRRGDLLKKLKLYRMRLPVAIEEDGRAVMASQGGGDGHLDARFGADVVRFHRKDPPPANAGDDDWKRLRWMDGIAEGADEIPPEKALPLEMRLELDDGIGFDKGCYIGQEVTARTRHRGLVKRSYVPVRVDGSVEAPAPVLADGRDAGTLLSVIDDDNGGMLGLASIRLEHLADDAPRLEAGGHTVAPFLPERLKPLPGKA